MLPEHLASTYENYKKDTNFFLTWLHNKAITCGYRSPLPSDSPDSQDQAKRSSSRLKGKARKEAKLLAANTASSATKIPKPPSKHVISTKELLLQAETVAKSTNPIVKVPEVVQKLLHDAICARKRCSAWFQRMKVEETRSENDDSNETHEHFISVLESAFQLLKPRFESSQRSVDPETSEAGDAVPHYGNPPDNLGNRFEHLEVEELDEESYNSIPSTTSTAEAGTRKDDGNISRDDVYEFELAKDAELSFGIYCFYEDLYKLRIFLNLMWKAVSEERLDHLSASLTSNVALELVRKSESELIALDRQRFGKDSYRSITSMIHPVALLKIPTEEDRQNMLERLTKSKIRDDTDYSETLEKSIFSEGDSQNAGEVADSDSGDEMQSQCDYFDSEDFIYLSAFYSLEKYANYVSFREKFPTVPEIGRLYLFNSHLYPNNNLWMHEDELLSQLLLELEVKSGHEYGLQQIDKARRAGWLPKLTEHQRKVSPFQDEITETLQNAALKAEISVSAVFEARILLDVAKITSGNAAKYYTSLRQIGADADAALGITWSHDKKIMKDRSGCVQTRDQLMREWAHRDVVCQAIHLSFAIKNNIKENRMIAYKQAVLKDLPQEIQNPPTAEENSTWQSLGLRMRWIAPSGTCTFYFDHHPIYCGMERLKLELGLEKTGFDFANACCSVASVAHLYNACQQRNLLQRKWHAIDKFIEVHISQLFRGERPQSSQQILNRFGLCMSLPATIFSREKPRSQPNWTRICQESTKMLDLPKISTILGNYFDKCDSGEKLLFNIHNMLNKGSASRKPVPSSLELLIQLSCCLQQSIPQLQTDLITLTKKCNKLLSKVRVAFKEILGIEHDKDGIDFAQYFPQYNVETVLRILHEARGADELREVRMRPYFGGTNSLEPQSTQLEIAAKVIEDFLDEANANISVEPIDVVASTCFDNLPPPSEKLVKKWNKIMSTFN
jgi:hypothetical protein